MSLKENLASKEFRERIPAACPNPILQTHNQVKAMLDRYDVFRHGYLSFDEFCIMMGPASVEGNEMHATFDALDLNHTGKLTASELKEVLVKIGGITSEEELRAMLHLADPSNSGVIDYNAFADMINRFDASPSPSSLRDRSFQALKRLILVSTQTMGCNNALPCYESQFLLRRGNTNTHFLDVTPSFG